MKIRFVEEAQAEFFEGIIYYEAARSGFGQRFKDKVDQCVLWIADHPQLYNIRSNGHKRINLRVFPYYIPFIVREDTLWILAIAHASKKPNYWISRRKEVF